MKIDKTMQFIKNPSLKFKNQLISQLLGSQHLNMSSEKKIYRKWYVLEYCEGDSKTFLRYLGLLSPDQEDAYRCNTPQKWPKNAEREIRKHFSGW